MHLFLHSLVQLQENNLLRKTIQVCRNIYSQAFLLQEEAFCVLLQQELLKQDNLQIQVCCQPALCLHCYKMPLLLHIHHPLSQI